jgi:hypothetical protein
MSSTSEGEEDHSSDDEPVTARNYVNTNNTSTPQHPGRNTNNATIAHSQRTNDGAEENGDINAAGKRALSYRMAKHLQKKHVNTRIQGLVKTVIFRKCKFLTNDEDFNKVMAVVIESEKPDDPGKFVRLYKTCVLGSLNSKRSSCQQAAADCVKALLKEKQHRDEVEPPPYSVDMLCKLRQSQSEEERRPSYGSRTHSWNVYAGK